MTGTADRPDRFSLVLSLTAVAACLGLLAYKFVLTRRLNVNWDEFYYLNFVHAAARGELKLLLNGAYTHIFAWLPLLEADEMGQIVAARVVMVALLCLTALLVWRLAKHWTDGFPALIAPFVFLASMPVMVHGGSFRSDSLLAPLTMAALVLLAKPGGRGRRREAVAGLLLGVAVAVTIKAALIAPLVAALLISRTAARSTAEGIDWGDATRSVTAVAIAAGVTATSLIFLHWLTVSSVPTESVTSFGSRAAVKTLIDVPWFPRLDYLRRYVHWQPLPWLLILLGTLAAIARRRFDLASLSLALLPIAAYRNAFPYYYVVMLGPASVLAAFSVQQMRDSVARWSRDTLASALVGVIWLGLLYQGLTYLGRLRFDDQGHQRMLVAAVHQVFPEPVNYIDRCGMISSFRKVNFFMSTWGMDNYRDRNEPFMPAAIRDNKPAFVLVNSSALNPNRPSDSGLLPADYELIEQFYPKFWGPLRVAGGSAKLAGAVSAPIRVPFPAEYRIAATGPILVDGIPRQHGDVVSVPAEGVIVSATSSVDETRVRLFLAIARPPPSEQLPGVSLFGSL